MTRRDVRRHVPRSSVFLLAALTAGLVLAQPAAAAVSAPIRLTTNDRDDVQPVTSAGNVAWSSIIDNGDGTSNDNEIMFYDGSTTRRLTNDGFYDLAPRISGGRVVWTKVKDAPGRSQVLLYDGTTVTAISDPSHEAANPEIDGSKVVWQLNSTDNPHVMDGWEIALHNGSTTTQLTDNAYGDFDPHLSGGDVVWVAATGYGRHDILRYDGSIVTNITGSSPADVRGHPRASGAGVCWRGDDSYRHPGEIYFFDGSTIHRLTSNETTEEPPRISGSKIVWAGHDGNDYEIYLYDGAKIVRLTNNAYDDLDPKVDGKYVVWTGYDGHDREIYLYDGSTVTKVTDNTRDDHDPEIGSGNIVWSGHDGTDLEIYLARVGVARPKPAAWISAPIAPSRVRRGAAFSIGGYLKPRHAGYTKVVLSRRTSAGRWAYYRTVWARNRDFRSYTRYSRAYRIRLRGSYRAIAYHGPDAGHRLTSSRARYFRVR